MSNLLTNSSLFAILVALLLNNYFETSEYGLRERRTAIRKWDDDYKPDLCNVCPEKQLIYAYGEKTFCQLGLTDERSGQWGWQIGPISPDTSSYIQNLYVNATDNDAITEKVVGYVRIKYKSKKVKIEVFGALNQTILCDGHIYVGYTEVQTIAPLQFTCLKKTNGKLDSSLCRFKGSYSKLVLDIDECENKNIFVVVTATFCSDQCRQVYSKPPPKTTYTSKRVITTEVTKTRTVTCDKYKTTTTTATETITYPPATYTECHTITENGTTSTTTVTKTDTATTTTTTRVCFTAYKTATETSTVTTFSPITTTLTIVSESPVTTTTTTRVTTTISGSVTIVPTVVTSVSTSTVTSSTTAVICTQEPTPKPVPTCIDLGYASPFNLYVSDGYEGESDVQGRLAVGGSASLKAGFSVGDQLTNVDKCKEAVMIVGGKVISWDSGRLYYGGLIYGDNSSSFNKYVLDSGCSAVSNPSFFDFNHATYDIKAANDFLCGLDPTVSSFSLTYGTLEFTLAGGSKIEVINIQDGNWLNGNVTYIKSPKNYTDGTVILFNIFGKTAGIQGINMDELRQLPVIFNFCEATTLTINSVAVRGWLIAPRASISGATGVIWGSTFVKSLSGSIQINVSPIPVCPYDQVSRNLYLPLTAGSQTSDAAKKTSAEWLSALWIALAAYFN